MGVALIKSDGFQIPKFCIQEIRCITKIEHKFYIKMLSGFQTGVFRKPFALTFSPHDVPTFLFFFKKFLPFRFKSKEEKQISITLQTARRIYDILFPHSINYCQTSTSLTTDSHTSSKAGEERWLHTKLCIFWYD